MSVNFTLFTDLKYCSDCFDRKETEIRACTKNQFKIYLPPRSLIEPRDYPDFYPDLRASAIYFGWKSKKITLYSFSDFISNLQSDIYNDQYPAEDDRSLLAELFLLEDLFDCDDSRLFVIGPKKCQKIYQDLLTAKSLINQLNSSLSHYDELEILFSLATNDCLVIVQN